MAGSRRLDINLHLDRSELERSEAAARASAKQMADEIISDADAAEKAKVEFVKRANRQKVEELSKTQKTETELNREAVASAESAAQKKAAADKKAAAEAMAAQKKKAQEAARFLEEEERKQQKLNSSQLDGVKSLIQMGAAMLGLQSGSAVIHGMMEDMDKAKAYGRKIAEDLLRMRGALRELAALRGEMGNTGPTTAHVLGMQAKTLQTAEEVNAMEQAALGIGELAIDKSISKEDFDKSLLAAGKMQTLEGGSADAYGALVGQIALQSDHKLSPEEMQGRLDRMFKIQQPGGFRNMSQAAGQYANLNDLAWIPMVAEFANKST